MAGTQQGVAVRSARFADVPTHTVRTAGGEFVYRELGSEHAGVPLVGLTHLGGNLDSWDPELVEPLAEARRIVLLSYRGVGASSGRPQDRFAEMAADAIAAIRALGLSRVDLFGLSMGGMVAQEILRQAPDLVERVVLAGAGPQGGPGLTVMTGVTVRTVLRALVQFTKPTSLLFFTRTHAGRQAAKAYQDRLKLRRADRDEPVSPGALRAQLRAVKRWGRQTPAANLFTGQVLIVHGDSDRMVPVGNADALLSRFPDAEVRLFADSGHGVAFQNRAAVAANTTRFLRR